MLTNTGQYSQIYTNTDTNRQINRQVCSLSSWNAIALTKLLPSEGYWHQKVPLCSQSLLPIPTALVQGL